MSPKGNANTGIRNADTIVMGDEKWCGRVDGTTAVDVASAPPVAAITLVLGRWRAKN